MIATFHKWLTKADAVSEKALLWVNVGLACFVTLAHGGAPAIVYGEPTPDAESIRKLASISIPIAALVIPTTIAALFGQGLRRPVLGLQGVVFACSAVVMILWGLGILVNGIPEGNSSRSVGLFTLWIAYSVYLLCRFTLPSHQRSHPAILYAPVVAFLGAALIDIGVFIRLAREMGAHFAS